jgi:2'-5' RNA ligase
MAQPEGRGRHDAMDAEEQRQFRNLRALTNHWSRPISPQAYYWYLTFEHSTELQAAAARCQQAIDFPYYDQTPVRDLHLTLDRIAFHREITSDQLSAITAATTQACRSVPPFTLSIGLLGGVSGAVGFTAHPEPTIARLRRTLRTVLSTCLGTSAEESRFHPHVAIAYANSDGVPAADVIAAVEELNCTAPSVNIVIDRATIALVERRPRSYSWQPVTRIPLAGST